MDIKKPNIKVPDIKMPDIKIPDIKAMAAGAVNENTRNEMFKKICALIPNKVDNSTVINAFDLMRKQQKLINKDFSANLKKNTEKFKAHVDKIKAAKGYVEDQNSYTDMAYGESTMQYSGCEILATYNAIFNIKGKHAIGLPEMISEYEKDGMVLSGKFGTSPKAICDFLGKHGFKTVLTTEESKFEELAKKSQSLILTMFNDKNDISQEVHTVNISKEGGKLTAHNVYGNGKVVGPCASMAEIMKNIHNGNSKGISLIGITENKA